MADKKTISFGRKKFKGRYKYQVGTRIFDDEATAKAYYDQEMEKLNKPEKLSFPNPVTGKTETALDSSALIKQLGHIATQDSIAQVKYIDDWLKQLSQLRLRESEFEQKGDATSLKVTRKRIKDVESKINELDTISTDEVPVKNEKEKSGYFDSFKKSVSEWWGGSVEAQSKKAWIESYAEQEREAFVNRELEVPPEFKSNPEKWYNKENKERTNQWYKQRAEEAYAEEMKIKDPAGIVDYIK